MSLPTDPLELLVFTLILASSPLLLYIGVKHLLSGFLPPERIKVPKPGKLEKILSPHLKSFVASLPRPAGDPLAAACQPIAPGLLPYFDDHGYVEAVYPLWKSGSKHSLAVRSWSKRKKERTEFVWSGEKPNELWEMRALTEQGFLADTLIGVMKTLDWSDRPQALGPARRASEALGFRYFDETLRWFTRSSTSDYSKAANADEDEGTTAEDRADAARFDFVTSIDEGKVNPDAAATSFGTP